MMAKTNREILYEINGALLDVLTLQERVEAGMIKNSMDVDKILRLCGNLQRRADFIMKKILNDLETKQEDLR